MIGRLLFTSMFVLPFPIMIMCFMSQHLRAAAIFMRLVLRRSSLSAPIRRSLLSPTTGADWKVKADTRIEADNEKAGVHVWCYNFSAEAHLFHDRSEIALPGWEQYILNRALRKRAKLLKMEKRASALAANDERIVRLADSFCAAYETRQ